MNRCDHDTNAGDNGSDDDVMTMNLVFLMIVSLGVS